MAETSISIPSWETDPCEGRRAPSYLAWERQSTERLSHARRENRFLPPQLDSAQQPHAAVPAKRSELLVTTPHTASAEQKWLLDFMSGIESVCSIQELSRTFLPVHFLLRAIDCPCVNGSDHITSPGVLMRFNYCSYNFSGRQCHINAKLDD